MFIILKIFEIMIIYIDSGIEVSVGCCKIIFLLFCSQMTVSILSLLDKYDSKFSFLNSNIYNSMALPPYGVLGFNIIGGYEIQGLPPAPRGVPQVEMSFSINVNNVLEVTAIEKRLNIELTVVEDYNWSKII